MCPKSHHHYHSRHCFLLHSLCYSCLPPVLFFINFYWKDLIHWKYLTVRNPPMVLYAAIGCTEFPPHISYTQSSLLGWHDTEGPAWKEVKKLLTFVPDTEQTSSCSCSKRYSCRSWLATHIFRQVQNCRNFSVIFLYFFFSSLEERWYIVISFECMYSD